MSQDQSSSNSERDIGQETISTEHQGVTSVEPVIQPEKQHEDVSVNTTIPNSKADSTGSGKGNKLKLIVFIVVVLLLGLIAYGLWKAYLPKTIELQGRVESETVHISTKVPSRIEEFYVTEGQTVKKGQAVVRFVSPELEAKKEQAQAALQSAMAFHSTVYRGTQQENIDTLYANWQAMKTQAELAATTYKRGENLYQQGVISRQRRDEMLAAQTSAREMAEAAY